MKFVLSLFPGIGILDAAFELEGFCVVRGPDLLWGGDIKRFHPPAGKFDGVIGGTPCQCFTSLVSLIRHNGQQVAENLIPEFERVVAEAQPSWFVMENVEGAPLAAVAGYKVDAALHDNRWIGGEQSRLHRFCFGTRDGRKLRFTDLVALDNPAAAPRVLGSTGGERKTPRAHGGGRIVKGMPWKEMVRLQGLPAGFDLPGFTKAGKHKALGNAVPFEMARSLARAVKAALEPELAR